MAGVSPSLQALGLAGQGDLTLDQRKQAEEDARKKAQLSPMSAAANSIATFFESYKTAAQELLGAPAQASNAVQNISAAAAADPKKLRK